MSIEVRNDGSAPVDIESQPAIAPRAPISIRPWQKHRYQVGSLLVGLVLVAALVANNFLARQYSPDGAVRQYLSAVESGDSSTAWKLITIAGGSSAVNLTDRAALEASFASGRPDVKSFTVDQPTTLDSNTAAVNFTYLTSGGTKDGSFVVKRAPSNNLGVYPAWEVAIKPVALHLGVPSGAGGVLVDGKALELSGPMDVGVLPLAHKIRIVGTAMVEPQTVAVDAFSGQPQTVTYSPTLTPLGAQKATATIKAAFTSCAKLTGVRPGGCPQAVDVSAVNSGQWQLVGDPTQNLSFAVDASANLVGEGHFQMVFSYQE
ncbi:MAG TPA: hypothetical protein VHO95_05370, partial [Candidatus Dormibacteraeota bacterium]|nr:hypothetical protein [Candidatus Dormibacteraeota bacterium]